MCASNPATRPSGQLDECVELGLSPDSLSEADIVPGPHALHGMAGLTGFSTRSYSLGSSGCVPSLRLYCVWSSFRCAVVELVSRLSSSLRAPRAWRRPGGECVGCDRVCKCVRRPPSKEIVLAYDTACGAGDAAGGTRTGGGR